MDAGCRSVKIIFDCVYVDGIIELNIYVHYRNLLNAISTFDTSSRATFHSFIQQHFQEIIIFYIYYQWRGERGLMTPRRHGENCWVGGCMGGYVVGSNLGTKHYGTQ